jgi:hypothetical protein
MKGGNYVRDNSIGICVLSIGNSGFWMDTKTTYQSWVARTGSMGSLHFAWWGPYRDQIKKEEFMKRKIRVSIVMVLVLLALAACASFDTNAYKTLAVAKTSYTQAMSALGSLQTQGKLSDAEVQKILPIARTYYQAYLITESAYEVYHANPTITNQDQLISLMNDVVLKLGNLSQILIPYNIAVNQIAVPAK